MRWVGRMQRLLTRDASLAVRLHAYMRLRTLNVMLLCEAASTPRTWSAPDCRPLSEVMPRNDKRNSSRSAMPSDKDADRRFTVLDSI